MKIADSSYRKTVQLMVIILTGLFAASCENSFEPLAENDQYHFSVFGAIDAAADTQWVRVSPVRDSILTSPEPIDARVSLTRVDTGDEIVMNDSLFYLQNNSYAWNFWTTDSIHYGEEYLFKAEDSDGNVTSARVFVPDNYPTPVVYYAEGSNTGRIEAEGINRLVVADLTHYFRTRRDGVLSPLFSESYSHMEDARQLSDGSFYVPVYVVQDLAEINRNYANSETVVLHEYKVATIISGGPGWPDNEDLTEEESYLPGVNSNVSNGLGVVVGIASKRIPFKSCRDDEGNVVACEELGPKRLLY